MNTATALDDSVQLTRTATAEPQQAQPLAAISQRQALTPVELLGIAVERGASMDQLERLIALKERWEATEARKAMVEAMAAFKSEPLEIFKRKAVGYATKEGDFVGYKHADLSDVAEVVVPALARHGMSHRWEIRQADGRIFVTCTVTHRAGHTESVTMDGAPDNSGKKNAIQQSASTVTYLQRYTLLALTGLATKGADDDGGGGAEDSPSLPAALLKDLHETATDAAAHAFWTVNRDQFKNTPQYEAFKQAVIVHRRNLGSQK